MPLCSRDYDPTQAVAGCSREPGTMHVLSYWYPDPTQAVAGCSRDYACFYPIGVRTPL